MQESTRMLVRASSEGDVQRAPSLFQFLIFLIFSRENGGENAFRPRQPTWPLHSRIGYGLTVKARSEAREADVRVVSM